MKAALLTRLRSPLEVVEVRLPDSLDVGQVLVRMAYSGICGSQIGEIDGVKGEDKFLPHLLGHEGSGMVEKTGPGVRHVKTGDTVVLHWQRGAGIGALPPKYLWKQTVVNAGPVTTFNEYAVVSENRLTAVDPATNLRVAALFGCAVTTGFGNVIHDAELKLGQSLLIIGAGGVGLNQIQAASLHSAFPVVAVDIYDEKLELAKSLGAHMVIHAKKVSLAEEVARLFPQGPDIVIENTGQVANIELAYSVVNKTSGRVVLVGVPGMDQKASLHTLGLHLGKSIRGSFGGQCRPQVDIPRYLNLYKQKKFALDALITEEFSLDQVNTAIERMKSGQISGRCLIRLNEGIL